MVVYSQLVQLSHNGLTLFHPNNTATSNRWIQSKLDTETMLVLQLKIVSISHALMNCQCIFSNCVSSNDHYLFSQGKKYANCIRVTYNPSCTNTNRKNLLQIVLHIFIFFFIISFFWKLLMENDTNKFD